MRLIDADALKATYFYPTNATNAPVLSFISLEAINDAPTIDAIPVVRCQDCKWWETYKGKPNQDEYNCYISEVFTNKDFFCAGGKRRTDG